MKIEEYNKIVKTIQKYRGLSKNCAKMLAEMYSSFPPTTLYSILSQEMQMKMKFSHRKVFGGDTNYYQIYKEELRKGENTGIILGMAMKLNTCPALLARKVLEAYCKLDDNNCSKSNISKLIRDTTLIPDYRLAYEILLCNLYDDQYGPIATAISESVGEQYEVKLEDYLNERNIPYLNENDLRTKGYDKTPDCKLEVPIAVNGFVVNWIESKAQFGSPDNHKKYIKEQFLSYWNRFGPGLVIYWFGYVDSITQSTETRFMVMDHFPENITYMDPTSITQPL